MSVRRRIEIRTPMFLAGCVAAIGTTTLPVHAKTEAEAADELIAVLGVTLPCPHFAVAWLKPPTTIEYRCTPSVGGAVRLREALPRERVGYIIDMQVARDRYISAYRLRAMPAPTVALAQFLAGITVLEKAGDGTTRRSSPLIVYGRGYASSLEAQGTAGTPAQHPTAERFPD